jgi:protein-S-isoprenylcysteine O-methyltransferase
MVIRVVLLVVVRFGLSEVALALIKRSRYRAARSEDRGSMRLLWLSIVLGEGVAFAAQWVPATRIPLPRPILNAVALALLLIGIGIRWAAILTLGKLFTVDVAIHSDHAVVQTGLYRFVRHPSYTGLLIAFLGFGVFFGNWLSIVGMLVPITLGVLHRVAREEQALLHSLGPAYESYCARTRRFIPWLL